MVPPSPRIEEIRPDRFRPPHCPWKTCLAHSDRKRFRWIRNGSYRRKCDVKKVPRFQCLTCNRGFSRQSFAATYYLKRPKLLEQVAAALVASSAHRQIARSLGCAHSTVTRLSARIGRHALLFQSVALDTLDDLKEPIAFDHFETFVYSQDDRLGIGTPVGRRSWFWYWIDPYAHRRAGKRSARKRTPKHPLPHLEVDEMARSTRRILDTLLDRFSGIDLLSDGAPAYGWAVASHPERHRIRHVSTPNPPRGRDAPEAAKARNDALHPADTLHTLVRHSQAHHRRETIAFGRRSNAVMERMATLMVWKNFVKQRSERKPDGVSPAMFLGLTSLRYTWEQIFSRRLFPRRIRMPSIGRKLYDRRLETPAVGRNQRHELRHAY